MYNVAFGKPVEFIEFLYRRLKKIIKPAVLLVLYKEERGNIKNLKWAPRPQNIFSYIKVYKTPKQ